jgi:hypothetical protein
MRLACQKDFKISDNGTSHIPRSKTTADSFIHSPFTMMSPRQHPFLLLVLLGAASTLPLASAWTAIIRPISAPRATRNILAAEKTNANCEQEHDDDAYFASIDHLSRRDLCRNVLLTGTGILTTAAVGAPFPAHALVKGVAPPPRSKPSGDKPKCTNVEECQAAADLKIQKQREEDIANPIPTSVTPGGTRYRDMEEGSGSLTAADGNEVTVYYKVLKLGKRAYDGLSGEGTVVFSRGYGLEDDETAPGSKDFRTTVGSFSNIAALNEVIPGMKVDGVRRFSILPQKGWRKPTKLCDGGPGGQGAGGDLKTDYVVVPTATMVAEEACFDQTKQPFPTTYAQQRRMAQRFDQSLCMEVKLISVGPARTSDF